MFAETACRVENVFFQVIAGMCNKISDLFQIFISKENMLWQHVMYISLMNKTIFFIVKTNQYLEKSRRHITE